MKREPMFVHVTVPSTVVLPSVALKAGTVPPEIPPVVTCWIVFVTGSAIFWPTVYVCVACHTAVFTGSGNR